MSIAFLYVVISCNDCGLNHMSEKYADRVAWAHVSIVGEGGKSLDVDLCPNCVEKHGVQKLLEFVEE